MAGAFDNFQTADPGAGWGDWGDAPARPSFPAGPDLASTRARYQKELEDPSTRRHLLALTHAEVGGQGPEAHQAFLETVFNRASARNKSLTDTIYDRNYFPSVTFQRANGVDPGTRYDSALKSVLDGSNISNYATGNASGSVRFNGGPQTFAAGGERFGVEGPDRSWVSRLISSVSPVSSAVAAEPKPATPSGVTRGPGSKTMATSDTTDTGDTGAMSWLAPVTRWLDQPLIADARKRMTGPNGEIIDNTTDAAAFAKKYGLGDVQGLQPMLGVYRMQNDLNAGALQPKGRTVGGTIGELLQTLGAAATASRGGAGVDTAYKMLNSGLSANRQSNEDLIQKLGLQSKIQAAQGLGTNLDATIKAQEEQRRRETERRRMIQEINAVDGGPSPTVPGPAGPAPMPEKVASIPTPSLPVPSADATGVPGIVATAPQGGPGAGVAPPAPPPVPVMTAAAPEAPVAAPAPTAPAAPAASAAPGVRQADAPLGEDGLPIGRAPDPATGANRPLPALSETPKDAVRPRMPQVTPVTPEEASLRRKAQIAKAYGDEKAFEDYSKQAAAVRAEVAAATKPTGDIQEFEYGRVNPGFRDWMISMKEAGAPKTTIDNKAEGAEAAAIGKGMGDLAVDTMKKGQAATKQMQDLAMLAALNDRIQTGKLAPVRMNLGAWAKELGVSEKTLEGWGVPKNFVGDAQAFSAQTSKMLTTLLGSGGFPSNNFSNADREFIMAAFPALANDPRGNKILLEVAMRAARADQAKASAWVDAQAQKIPYSTFEARWNRTIAQQDQLGDLRAQAEAILGPKAPPSRQPSPSPTAAAPRRVQAIGPDGRRVIMTEQPDGTFAEEK